MADSPFFIDSLPAELIERVIDGREEVKMQGPGDMPVWDDWFDYDAKAARLRAAEREIVVRERNIGKCRGPLSSSGARKRWPVCTRL